MKLEKAIEELTLAIQNPYHFESPKGRGAIKLGIEALKRIKQDRIVNDDLNPYLLSGETKD